MAIQNLTFTVILGFPWWRKHRGDFNWDNQTIQLNINNQIVQVPSKSPSCLLIEPYTKGVFQIEIINDSIPNTLPSFLTPYLDCFEEPSQLPLPEHREIYLRLELF